ncbi:MAG: NAD-dependent epimerase/dehydratase family protein [Chryseolinea sp.]
MSLKIILTGATGFVGEGVLFECLENTEVKEVLMLNRKHYDLKHPKLKELLVPDFMKLDSVLEDLVGYDACFYCAGISSVGLNEKAYTHITYDTTLHFARELLVKNSNMVFTFVTGSHTDSSEKGKVMWARVKGKTENALGKLGFKKQYNVRPGFMKPTPGQKNVKSLYKIIGAVFPLLFPKSSSTVQELGLAMIHATLKGYPNQTLEIKDIKHLARG